ncbi:hypothetical protein H311_01742, partial [Anncaliia algerae PRA109]
ILNRIQNNNDYSNIKPTYSEPSHFNGDLSHPDFYYDNKNEKGNYQGNDSFTANTLFKFS